MDADEHGIPSLLELSVAMLKRFVHVLDDLGVVPIDLIWEVLAAASPEELATIEDATAVGVSPRHLITETWPLWWKHCTSGSLAAFTTMPSNLPPLPMLPKDGTPSRPACAHLTLPSTVIPADYRAVYTQLTQQLHQRRSQLGKRLKEKRLEGEKDRLSRSIQVIEAPQKRNKGQRFSSQTATPTVKDRLMKKLHIPSANMKHTINSRATVKAPTAMLGKMKKKKPTLPTRSALAGKVSLPRVELKSSIPNKKRVSMLIEDDLFKR